MTHFLKIARTSVITLLAAGVSSGAAIAAPKDNQDITVNFMGLPVGQPITSQITLPLLTKDQLVTLDKNSMPDVLAIMQLQAAYEFYHDAHNGQGVASLFTEDGVFEIPFNDGLGHLSPTGGIGGNGCAAFGRDQIAIFFNAANGVAPLPFPHHAHHVMTSMVVTIYDGGYFATLNANYVDDSVSATGVASVGNMGEYITDFVRTEKDGWLIRQLRPVEDQPIATANCTLAGQLPK
jgi:SnoaL-like domain